jgi:hypothetical protein
MRRDDSRGIQVVGRLTEGQSGSPERSLKSKPTWWDTSGYSATSAFLLVLGGAAVDGRLWNQWNKQNRLSSVISTIGMELQCFFPGYHPSTLSGKGFTYTCVMG